MPGLPGRSHLIQGQPHQPLPGALNARNAAKSRTVVAPTIPAPPDMDPQMACLINYAVSLACRCITDELRWTPQTARSPSHVQVPFSAQKFHRHRGTGIVTDPPIALPGVGPGGPFTEIIDFQTPDLFRGVLNFWGIDVNPIGSLANIDVRIMKNSSPLDIMTTEYGSVVGASAGFWEGPPFSIANPNRDICEHLSRRDRISFQMRNTLLPGPGAINVAAVIGGWIYPPTRDSGENAIYGTFTDNPERY
jgi:hypothetical protein